MTERKGIDVIMNFLSGEALQKSLTVLAPFGRFIEIGKRDIEENNALPLHAFNRNLTFSAVDMDLLAKARPATLHHFLREVCDGFSTNRFHPVVTEIFALTDIGEACRLMIKAKHIGKCVLQVEDQKVPVVMPVGHANSELVAQTDRLEAKLERRCHAG